jgi:hypothetical protein
MGEKHLTVYCDIAIGQSTHGRRLEEICDWQAERTRERLEHWAAA